ncbi:hypothetical protein J6590_058728 [Homalodisca vitripennis]|nr:hypothetical protein J6590_058728 [Homalodisca vitripennis]
MINRLCLNPDNGCRFGHWRSNCELWCTFWCSCAVEDWKPFSIAGYFGADFGERPSDQCWPGLTTADQPTQRRDTALPRICAVTSRGDCRLPPGLYRLPPGLCHLPPGLCRARRPCRAALRSDRSRLPVG